MKVTSTPNNTHWLDIAEIIAVGGSVVGSITSIFLNQFLWATLPLSASATFTLLNHRRLRNVIQTEFSQKQAEVTQLIEENKGEINKSKAKYQKNKAGIVELRKELSGNSNLTMLRLNQLQKEEHKNNGNTIKKLEKVETSLSQLNSLTHKLEKNLDIINNKQKETQKMVIELKAIDTFTQNIKANLNSVQSYFERGFAYQRLGNKQRAIEDYTKAIELSSNHAHAYHHRGLLYAELEINQKAVLDLRKASQLYFDRGDLNKYRETRDLSQEIQQLDRAAEADKIENNETEQVKVSNLFA